MFTDTEKLTLADIENLDFTTVIWIAAPLMFLFVLIEFLIGRKKYKNLYSGKDFLASSAIGIGNLILNGFMKIGVFMVFLFFFNLAPFKIPHTWWSYVLCLILLDFSRYWSHRLAHEQRFWWSTHVVHHSSEHYNLSTSFRLSWTQNLKIIFFLPVVLLGFHPLVFFIVHQLEVLYQFWIHTELIKKLPRPIEYIFTTPSHHRVHHSVNEKYLDKNYGSTFIFWDRIFGTFQEEDEKPRYGITKPVNSYNPFFLVFHEWIEISKDIWKARSLKEAWLILFGSPVDKHKEDMGIKGKPDAELTSIGKANEEFKVKKAN
ncbi:sterol desaturase/sphingolipid hydroxylase (fatty acid hydroxylase superfamily) [Salegentibacter sp. 24]|jgi:sterol desaturase/sphingolipid hydroxylase (fatty acid hydroxylase superfamily)|uniref:sterol desaturase family protein n=1 Tax=Salegentibacter sp. 24 TaxID=2183986 RepID=UPI0010610E6C|nr:sterol desaturase family protein [Salegentibacter sp. 24]TDN87644.1 sterol desaturase/sphingolipid hydroxylase (fatty acid hydroxylase superfamily) [Salegentibacter sp. 24]